MQEREMKALVIAAKSKLTRDGDKWLVPSQSSGRNYVVDPNPQAPTCNCPDFELRQLRCKHIFAAEIVIERESTTTRTRKGDTTTTTITETVRVRYSQDWQAYNAAQTQEKALFQHLLHDLCSGIAKPPRVKGRRAFSLGDMIFASTFKVYSTVSGRRFVTDLKTAFEKGYLDRLPSYNTIFRYFEKPALTPLLKALITQSALPLKAIETDFAIDSSGFSTCNYVRWFNVKYGKEVDAHDWLKVHLMCGVKTNVVTSVEITGRSGQGSADPNQLKPLVEQTAKHFNIQEVSADKAYSSTKSHDLIASVGATPYIAFKSNTKALAGGLFEKMFHFFSYNRESFLEHYHKRSNSETTFSMIKSKFGSSIRSKTSVAQTNEALAKVLCHNLCCVIQSMFEFKIDPNFQSKESAPAYVGPGSNGGEPSATYSVNLLAEALNV
jgi:transposase